jgi:hypothetical protein
LSFEDGYAVLTGEWRDGDEILITYDMSIRATFPISWETDVIYTDMRNLRPGYHCAAAKTVTHRAEDDRFLSLSRGPLTLCADSRTGKAASSVFSLIHKDGAIRGHICEKKEIIEGVPCVVRCELTDTDGKTVILVDYGSAGRDWSTEIAAWLPTE